MEQYYFLPICRSIYNLFPIPPFLLNALMANIENPSIYTNELVYLRYIHSQLFLNYGRQPKYLLLLMTYAIPYILSPLQTKSLTN